VLGIPCFSLLYAWAGGFSWILTGGYSHDMILYLGLLIVAWGFNTLCGPAYFTNMGTGEVGWNTIGHAIMAILNVGLGWVLGERFGGFGVVSAYSIALITGSLFLIGIFQKKNAIKWGMIIEKEDLGVILASAAVVITGLLLPLKPSMSELPKTFSLVLIPLLIVGAAIFNHPIRKELYKTIKKTSGNNYQI